MEHNDEGAVEFGTHSANFDEIEEANTTPAGQDLTKITVNGDDVPEEFRGKSVAEIIAAAKARDKALEISETARLALKNSQEALEGSQRPAAPAPSPSPAPEPELTPEQLRELFEKDPFEYQLYRDQQLEKRVSSLVSSRLAPVVGNTADIAIREAKSRFPKEFAALDKEITTLISGMPDKSVLANPGAIDELVHYARGKHVDKFFEYISSQNGGGLEDARNSAASQAPTFTNRSPTPQPQLYGGVQLDQTELEVAAALGVKPEDYAKNKPRQRGRNG